MVNDEDENGDDNGDNHNHGLPATVLAGDDDHGDHHNHNGGALPATVVAGDGDNDEGDVDLPDTMMDDLFAFGSDGHDGAEDERARSEVSPLQRSDGMIIPTLP